VPSRFPLRQARSGVTEDLKSNRVKSVSAAIFSLALLSASHFQKKRLYTQSALKTFFIYKHECEIITKNSDDKWLRIPLKGFKLLRD